jgi:hypothetical protein
MKNTRKQGHISTLLQIIHDEFDLVVNAATVDELQWLAERAAVLKTLTKRLCVDHIKPL